MKKLYLILLGILCLASTSLIAQTQVTGKVSDARGEALIGASVTVKGTSTGTITDFSGNYELNVPGSDVTLVFTYTGFVMQEVALAGRTRVDVTLLEDVKTLDEFVVVGYGTQRKTDLTGSVSSIKGSDIALAPIQSFDQALQGRAAGVNITTPNGVVNNPPVIRIRGINSINLSSQPLIVIDGVPTFTGDQSTNSAPNNPLANINPADIESMEVLKDASASAIYGSRAAAGVILITTKRGSKGVTRVNYDAWVGATQAFRLFDLLNADQYMEIKNEGVRNLSGPNAPPRFNPTLDVNGNTVDTDWYDYTYRTGIAHNHNLSFSGGNDRTNYFSSIGFTQQEGMLINNDFQRSIIRLNLDHKLLDNVTIGTSLSYTNSVNKAPNTGSIPGAGFSIAGLGRLPLVLAPNVAPYIDADGRGAYEPGDGIRFNTSPANTVGAMGNLDIGFYNAAAILDLNRFSSENNHFIANVYADIRILKGLNFRTTYGVDRLGIEDQTFWAREHGDGFGQGGFAQNIFATLNRWNWQNTLQYVFDINDRNRFNFLVGGEQQHTVQDRWGATRSQISDPFFTSFQGNFTTITAAGNLQTENYLLSYFGRFNYAFDNKFLATFNYRRDGYSAFAPGRKYGDFYGASVGYVLSEENFWKNTFGNTFNFFKIRGSYGVVGNNAVANFASLSLFGAGLYGPDASLQFAQAGNPLLSWESSKKTDVGFSFGLLNDRIQGEFAYYINDVDGLILDVPQAPSKGIPNNTVSTNIGAMVNSGIELTVNVNAIRSRNFDWSFDLNFTTQNNVVNALGPDGSDIFGATAGLESTNITRIGQSIGSIYAVQTAGVNPANGQRIFLRRQVVNGDTTYIQVQYDHAAPAASRWTLVSDGSVTQAPSLANSGVVYGPTIPTWYGGFNNNFRFMQFDLNIMFQFSGGNYIYNGTKAGLRDMRFWNNHTDMLDRWTESNTSGSIPKVVYTDNVSNGSAFPISENVEKGDFMRLRNVSLGYTLPFATAQRIRLSNLRIYAQIQNAFILTPYTGIDPEISTNGSSNITPGVDRNSVGQARTYTFGIQIGL